MSWSNIKQLKSYKGNSFTYDSAGMRLSKNSIQYTYDGDRLLKEDRNGTPIYYYYGVDGIAAFEYNGEYYYYVKNLLGDVTELFCIQISGSGNNQGKQLCYCARLYFGSNFRVRVFSDPTLCNMALICKHNINYAGLVITCKHILL